MSEEVQELWGRTAEALGAVGLYDVASSLTWGYLPLPCGRCGLHPSRPVDDCERCGAALDDPDDVAETSWWAEVVWHGGGAYRTTGAGEQGAIDAAERVLDAVRSRWRQEFTRLVRKRAARAERSDRPMHVRYLCGDHPLPPEIDEVPVAVDRLPDGKIAYRFTPSQARAMMRRANNDGRDPDGDQDRQG